MSLKARGYQQINFAGPGQMQSDAVIWDVLGKHFCSFKTSTCPLANGYYGTILEEDGVCYLYLKTVERAHTPRTMWEKIKLSEDTAKAFEQIDRHMLNIYKDYQIQRCKKRLCKIREYLQRMRQIAAKPTKQLEFEAKKVMKREAAREKVALRAAKLQTTVEQELISRLKAGHYGDIYNFSPEFQQILDADEEEEEEIERGEEESQMEPDIEELA